jgi:acyl-CoA synthetase (AMP-forming)/AMP-acid ligase II
VPEVRPAVACLFGLWALGAVPIQIGLPFRFDNHALFLENLAQTASRLDARLLIVPSSLAPMAPQSRIRSLAVESILAHEPTTGLRDPDETGGIAFIQLTSGTTSRPRGVVVRHDRLMLHMEMMSRALPSHPDSVGVSWLPLHHDMGLLGGLLFPFYNGFPGNMISSREFQRQPWLWLQAMSRFRSTITAAPASAYAICIPLAERLIAAGLDLRACACAMVGAEPVSASLLRRFSAAFAPSGFRADAFFPVYGLAEATVAVTFPKLLSPARIDRIDRCVLEREGLAARVGEDRNALEFVGVGEPIPGAEVRIAGESGAALPERVVGEIHVRSTTLMTGYYGEPEATGDALVDGWLRTGDLGYQADGMLFVTGRKKELIIKGGHNLIPSVLEEIASGVEGVRPGAVAAIGIHSASRESELVCIVAETRFDRVDHPVLSARIRAALKTHGVVVD